MPWRTSTQIINNNLGPDKYSKTSEFFKSNEITQPKGETAHSKRLNG